MPQIYFQRLVVKPMWATFFNWPDGNVWGNLVANFLWAVPLYLYGRFHFKRLRIKQHEIHEDIKKLVGEQS